MTPRTKNKVTIVEVTGVTGAGKTALLNAVKDVLADQGFEARDAYDLILARYGLNLAPYPTLRSLLIDLVAFPPFLRYISTRKGLQLLFLAIRVLSRDAGGFLVALNLGRNIAKRIGVHILLTRPLRNSGECDIAVCDEGTLHIAHNLFVHSNRAPDPSEIAHFGSIVPKPDVVIWVRATQKQSIESIMRRGHSRVGDSINAAQAFVEHGCMTFNVLCSQEAIQDKLFVIDSAADNVTDDLVSVQESAHAVAAFLRQGLIVNEVNSPSGQPLAT